MMKNNLIIGGIIVVLVGAGMFFLGKSSSNTESVIVDEKEEVVVDGSTTTDENATSTDEMEGEVVDLTKTTIGTSIEGRDIVAYHYGEGETELLFIGGIHGGYSWNTTLVAYEMMDYLDKNPSIVPESIKVTVIPVLNPDGLQKVTDSSARFSTSDITAGEAQRIAGRFNANGVDLNRNFDCGWKAEATWKNEAVSGGSEEFSEPEALAIKNYVDANNPKAAVVWYSSAGGVFSSNCQDGVSKETIALTNVYANASLYKAYEEFDFYEVTGDMVNWLAKKDIPAISVLLTSHEEVEWPKNRAGIEAVLEYYAN